MVLSLVITLHVAETSSVIQFNPKKNKFLVISFIFIRQN